MKSGIYKIENITNGKIYVGSALSIEARWRRHRHDLRHGKHHSLKLQRAFNKCGEGAFQFIVVELVDRDSLLTREQYWIGALNSEKSGYNVNPKAGSPLGRKTSEATREKLRSLVISAETRLKMSSAKKGKVPEIALSAAIKANTGRPLSADRIEKIRASNTGKRHSDETRRKLSEINKGKKYGPRSIEQRARMSEVQKNRVLSDSARVSISKAITERNHNTVQSEETKMKRKDTWAKKKLLKQMAGSQCNQD